MPPMRFLTRGCFQRVGCRAPLPGGWLPCQDETNHARPDQSFKLGGKVLATAPLWIGHTLDLIVKVTNGDRRGGMLLLPNFEELDNRLPPIVTLLGLADAIDGIFAAERKQRIAYPGSPLLKTPKHAA